MQGYGGGGAPPGGHPAQIYPYMYAPPGGQPSSMYRTPSGTTPYPVPSSQSSHFVSSPYGMPPGMPSMQQQPIIPTESRMPRPKRFTDRSKRQEERPSQKPLKSAMKKSNSLSMPPSQYRDANGQTTSLWRSRTAQAQKVPSPEGEEEEEIHMRQGRKEQRISRVPSAGALVRTRTASDPQRPRTRANSTSRPRSRANGREVYTPGHIFVQISGTNRLHMSSVMFQSTVDDIRERVLTMWPDGILFQTYHDDTNEFEASFSGTPWTAKGNLGLIAMRLILELFAVLARQGYVCTSALDTGLTTGYPRLVFSVTKADPDVQFFMICFSNNRRKIKFINHPVDLGQMIAELLREHFPRRITSATWDESDMFRIELGRWDSESTPSLVMATILQHCTTEGYKLECTIPLTHQGLFGMLQGKKELWIMKRMAIYNQS